MQLIRDASALLPLQGGVLVPTMGALHEGHLSLIRLAVAASMRNGSPVLVSVFVNPTQFDDRADYERYPSSLEQDIAACEREGVDAVFAPDCDTVYPPAEAVATPPLPSVATEPGLEDRMRPGHFAGVCQVVKRLFDLARPRAAVFGEKDWQQYRVIDAMVAREGLAIDILPGPTVREPDGLAMSSRNRFLAGPDRARALSLSRGLRRAQRAETLGQAEAAIRAEMEASEMSVDYAVVRDAGTLLPAAGQDRPPRPLRALAAGRLRTASGEVRLIDNMPWPGL